MRQIKLNRSKSTVVFFETVEDFAAEDEEPSLIDIIVNRAYSLKSDKEAREFIGKAVLMMVMVLKMPRNHTSEALARAWLVDTLDVRVDLHTTDPYKDRWFDHRLYPRLSHLAQRNPMAFRKFQTAIGKFISLPDLSSTNPTIWRKKPA